MNAARDRLRGQLERGGFLFNPRPQDREKLGGILVAMVVRGRRINVRLDMSHHAIGAGLLIGIACLAALGAGLSAAGATNSCVDCHMVARAEGLGGYAYPGLMGLARNHLAQWEYSAHARADVTCDKCHGGDPAAYDTVAAHRGVRNGRDPASPVSRINLVGTCGHCHPNVAREFRKSRHAALLQDGDARMPTCTTCHDEVGALLLSPRSLETECATCHGRGRSAPRPEYPARARSLLERGRQIRTMLNQADATIRRMKTSPRRTAMTQAFEEARRPFTDAVDAGHAFNFEYLDTRLTSARQRAEALLQRIADR